MVLAVHSLGDALILFKAMVLLAQFRVTTAIKSLFAATSASSTSLNHLEVRLPVLFHLLLRPTQQLNTT